MTVAVPETMPSAPALSAESSSTPLVTRMPRSVALMRAEIVLTPTASCVIRGAADVPLCARRSSTPLLTT